MTAPATRRLLVIAHRGASGHRPEHTLASYQLALDLGADFVEPDLVATRDGELICRHENALAVLNPDGSLDTTETSTDVYRRADFAARLAVKQVDGRTVRGWFAEDFTLAEIRTLRAIERLPALRPANVSYNGCFAIPTFSEVLALVDAHAARTGHRAGVYPETKHPSYFLHEGRHLDGARIGIDLGERLVADLHAAGFTDPSRVFIQSFETANLRELRARVMPRHGVQFPLIQLCEADGAPRDTVLAGQPLTYRSMLTPAGLAEIARYATGIGPFKGLLLPRAADDTLGAAGPILSDAQAAGLQVHAWTFRAENHFLPRECRRGAAPAQPGDLDSEIRAFVTAGVDGVFADHPEAAVRVRDGR